MNPLAKHGLLAAICLILALSGCSKKTDNGKGGDKGKDAAATIDQSSPEKVAESFKAAAKAKDWNTMFACTTKESHMLTLHMLIFDVRVTFRAFGDKAQKESFEALMKKHGVDTSKKVGPNDDLTAGTKDKGALFGDLVDLIDKNTPKTKDGKPRKTLSERFSSVEFTNFKTDGDSATADQKVEGKPDETAYFKKIDDKWYIDFVKGMQNRKGYPRLEKGPPPFPK
jgi:hypothetical protein